MRDRTRLARAIAALFVVAVLAAACGDGNGDGDAAAGATDPTGATAAVETGDDTGGGDDGGRYGEDDGDEGSDAGDGGAAAVQANNFSFDPAEVEVESGEDLTVKNGNANTPHTFTVDDGAIDVELAPLASEEVTVDLDPGTYDVVCRFHPDMTATLTVT